VDWELTARALPYLACNLFVGMDKEFRRVDSVQDEMAVFEDIPPNATVKVRMAVVSDTDNGVTSEVVEFQVLALSKAA
jgi:hypothetical protein